MFKKSQTTIKQLDPANNFEFKEPRRKIRFLKRACLLIIFLLLIVGIFLGTKAFLASRKIITRSNGGAPVLTGTGLRSEGDGRVNILLLGIGGQGHEGPNLSDTIMIMSLDLKTNSVALLSIPRDLYVSIPEHGKAKINAAYSYGESEKYPGGGAALAKTTVSQLLDLPIHYYVVLDFAGFRDAVNALGGVDINVDKTINDPYYPSDSENGRYTPFYITTGLHHMDGALALKYARSRETSSDFDRAMRQQKVLIALKQKALSGSTLINPLKIGGLIDALGNHVRTDLQLNEIKKLLEVSKNIDTTKIVTKVLDNASTGLLISGSNWAGSVLLPKDGDWSDIQEFVHSLFVDSYIKNEAANIEVQNGTNRSGLAIQVAKMLTAYNYNVIKITTNQTQLSKTAIYDYSNGKKPYTINYLENRFKVKAQVTSQSSDMDIKIIIGNDYSM